ncbi:unnamed protein product [Rhizopus stolonifer]
MEDQWKTTAQQNLKNKTQETWKMSAKPRHAQLIQQDSPVKRQSAPVYRKPLPQEPTTSFHSSGFFPPSQSYYPQDIYSQNYPHNYPQDIYSHPQNYSQDVFPQNYAQDIYSQQQQHQDYGNQHDLYSPPQHSEYRSEINAEYSQFAQPAQAMVPPPPVMSPPTVTTPPQHTPHILSDPPSTEIKKETTKEKKTRQITVQSINKEHRVWIDVLPSETGLSLAEKIHIIATFRTRKIVSITTASGRKVPLDHRPVFGNWVDMDNFENGERWMVDWCENDRGVMERFISKVVQAGGGKRSKDHIAKDTNK